MNKKCVVLLSGGLDSTTTLAIAISEGFKPYAITFDYNQRHRIEIERAKMTAEKYGVHQLIFPLPLNLIGGSALTDNIDVPDNKIEEIGKGIPITYVPARNSIFLSVASAWAEAKEINDIFIGVNTLDYSGYPDCRKEFIDAMGRALTLGTKFHDRGKRIVIHTPLADMTKAEIIKRGSELGVDYSLTSSCYNPDEKGRACGKCDSCKLRLKGFAEAGLKDPLEYQ